MRLQFRDGHAQSPVPVAPGEHLPFAHVLGRVAPHGMGLALGGVSYSVLATFVTLFYASRHWNGAALCLTAFGVGFILARIVFIHTINVFGGFPVAIASLLVEAFGMVLLWISHSPWMAMAGSAVCGFGFSLIFPAIGVEAVKRVPEFNRGTALGVYTAFADVSFFLVGPVAGALIGFYGYDSMFVFALISILVALGIVVVLSRMQTEFSRFPATVQSLATKPSSSNVMLRNEATKHLACGAGPGGISRRRYGCPRCIESRPGAPST